MNKTKFLHSKIQYTNVLGNKYVEGFKVFNILDVRDAVDELKKETCDLYHKISKTKVWKANNDEVCDLCEEYVIKKVNEIFEDVTEEK